MSDALKVLVGPAAQGLSASTVARLKQSWREILLSLKLRGLKTPEVAVGDRAMGFCSALDAVFPHTRHQRCWMHKTGNVLNYLPSLSQAKAKQALHEIWRTETKQHAEEAFNRFIKTYEAK